MEDKKPAPPPVDDLDLPTELASDTEAAVIDDSVLDADLDASLARLEAVRAARAQADQAEAEALAEISADVQDTVDQHMADGTLDELARDAETAPTADPEANGIESMDDAAIPDLDIPEDLAASNAGRFSDTPADFPPADEPVDEAVNGISEYHREDESDLDEPASLLQPEPAPEIEPIPEPVKPTVQVADLPQTDFRSKDIEDLLRSTGIDLEPKQSAGDVAVRPDSEVSVPADEQQAPAERISKAKVAGIVALLIAGATAWFFTRPSPAPVTTPATEILKPAPDAAITAPGQAPAGSAGGPGGVPADEPTVFEPDTSDRQAEIQRQVEATTNVWPADKRTCGELYTGYDRRLCTTVGAQTYFKCSPDGVRWDATIAGCKLSVQ